MYSPLFCSREDFVADLDLSLSVERTFKSERCSYWNAILWSLCSPFPSRL